MPPPSTINHCIKEEVKKGEQEKKKKTWELVRKKWKEKYKPNKTSNMQGNFLMREKAYFHLKLTQTHYYRQKVIKLVT